MKLPRLFAGIVLGIATTTWSLHAGVTTRASVRSDGAQGNGDSTIAAISADGRFVVFMSLATNLVANDTNGAADIFRHDRLSGTTIRVSINSQGVEGNADSGILAPPQVTPGGRFVVFASSASNLVADDHNGVLDVFLHDCEAGTTTRVSLNSSGVEGNDTSGFLVVSLSQDARFVCFDSLASNLVTDDTNGALDVFVHDRQSGQTVRASVDSKGLEGNGDSTAGWLSADGMVVGFSSLATNLVAGDTNGLADVFVHDRTTGLTERVSVDSSGVQGNGSSFGATLSADGRLVAFEGYASNLTVDDHNNASDVFVHDRTTGMTRGVSRGVDGKQFAYGAFDQMLAADGRFVAFSAMPTFLHQRVYVHEIASGLTTEVSVNSEGETGNSNQNICYFGALSADGSACTYYASSSNLVAGDTNERWDAFVQLRATLHFDGVPTSGSACRFVAERMEPGNLSLVLLSSTGTDGFLIGKKRIPLTLDALTVAGFALYPLLSAVADANGTAETPLFVMPMVGGGLTFHATAASTELTSGEIESITSPITVTTQ